VSLFVESIGFGIASGAIISLAAVGFTVQFAVSNAFNIAYGAVMTLAAFLGYWMLQAGVDVWVALGLTSAIVGVLTVGFNRGLLAPLQRRTASRVAVIIGTVSAGTIIQYAVAAVAGPQARSYGNHGGATVAGLGFRFTTAQVALIGLTIAVMLGFHFLLTRTQLGRAMRATAANRTLARACGIRTARIIDIAWLLTGAMCGAAGVALAMTTVTFDFNLGSTFLIYVIAASVFGGLGQPYGAMAGGLVMGIVSQLAAAYWNPAYQDVVAFGILILMLLVRPAGLFAAVSSRRSLAGA
jgi:branched-chain amino acid transport system permease protein/neutral amino acid transport system permease protein